MDNWQNYIQKVIIPNLPHRTDRKNRIVEMLYEYGIEATIWEATRHNKGYLGLMTTMKNIFQWCLDNAIERVLILEDDCEMLVNPSEFNLILDDCCEDLKRINWQIFYLGLQHVMQFKNWITPNILPVTMGFSTHSVLYNSHAMKFFVTNQFDQPIDNFLVEKYQKYNTSFCSYPMLCSQVAGHSDIGENYIDWKPFLEGKFNQQVQPILNKRYEVH